MSAVSPTHPSSEYPITHWSTAQLHSALHHGDITIWRMIIMRVKHDPYGRTAHQVEEILHTIPSTGIAKVLRDVLVKSRDHLHARERAEVARYIRTLMNCSTLTPREFSSRIGVKLDELNDYLNGTISPPASLIIRMRRVVDRFPKSDPSKS